MDLSKILEYQKQDAKIFKLENIINNSENKKIYNKMYGIVKDAQNKSAFLEKKAGEIVKEMNELKKIYSDNVKNTNVISSKSLEKSSEEDLSTMSDIIKKISSNLSIIEKRLARLAESLNQTLNEFNQVKARNKTAVEEYKKRKEMYEKETADLMPQKEQLITELKKLEKDLPADVIAKYKKHRQDNIFPVLVPSKNKSCGGCQMELPAQQLAILKKDGILECEHCGRIIYYVEG